jgi:hypothetical protein
MIEEAKAIKAFPPEDRKHESRRVPWPVAAERKLHGVL